MKVSRALIRRVIWALAALLFLFALYVFTAALFDGDDVGGAIAIWFLAVPALTLSITTGAIAVWMAEPGVATSTSVARSLAAALRALLIPLSVGLLVPTSMLLFAVCAAGA